MNKIIIKCIFGLSCLFTTACDEYYEVTNDRGGTSPQETVDLIKKASIKWGMSRDSLIQHMSGYSKVTETNNNILVFRDSKNKQAISYLLKDERLCATTIVMPCLSEETASMPILSGYEYCGRLAQADIYERMDNNTMAAVWDVIENDSSFSAFGFAPIASSAYVPAAPLFATTKEVVSTGYSDAKVSGSVSGAESVAEVGFIYGKNNSLSEYSDQKVSSTSKGEFTLTLTGLTDDATYYYCAYAIVDDIYYMGEIKSFKTKPYTYTMGGKTYKMVKIEGGPMPDFSIMQTEWTDYSNLDQNHDGAIIKAEFRGFLDKLREETGLNLRLPTMEEWKYAASGGSSTQNYKYSGSNNIDDVAWYKNNCKGIQTAAEKKANELGLYDMSGNYGELTNDTDDEYYVDGEICGGCWKDDAANCTIESFIPGIRSGKVPGTQINEKNAYDGTKVSFRLVYTR